MFNVAIVDKAQDFRTIALIEGFFTYRDANVYARSIVLMPYEEWTITEVNNSEDADLVTV